MDMKLVDEIRRLIRRQNGKRLSNARIEKWLDSKHTRERAALRYYVRLNGGYSEH